MNKAWSDLISNAVEEGKPSCLTCFNLHVKEHGKYLRCEKLPISKNAEKNPASIEWERSQRAAKDCAYYEGEE
jgi:hypothetical protein